ncbi:hypothetical protein P171DRAFT_467884 [Karstenula rhodostoma CBS 690.94]|uniref:Secreted protein n=1 Tax=Karstenula rhodostoma CBS 690.94 TaxID=1392251 RepID=A0A9P4PTW7_9PLEO|nr:hypothetical protein P171DRAFT_467884 [Karstenula rhodostoma CBS 690.94]
MTMAVCSAQPCTLAWLISVFSRGSVAFSVYTHGRLFHSQSPHSTPSSVPPPLSLFSIRVISLSDRYLCTIMHSTGS